jgi:hypothetical protein
MEGKDILCPSQPLTSSNLKTSMGSRGSGAKEEFKGLKGPRVLFSAFCLHIWQLIRDTSFCVLLQILPLKVIGDSHQFGLGQRLKGLSLFPIKQETQSKK